ncbi:MAG: Uncharacterized protein G01um101418_322 [Parcubacteria group bacterium Gr01-1014_18]|nr:MAG: Uncharacterized protein Greene041636_302 [Parcubacteria group bacterium Greene0416_36]TSC81182.1 MAG: Uncharacterized protein G01um101418_322 [Parcubacteria group bacterium Gr01-1014_18]TSC99179.1 MAG: Uncharacterized protein Greene101420_324 [Parcubacteria group bacterium Greene1014_20]TSD07463.1 MAG: Uncharacterized protein Greene07142_162 [Parcubacteria group bacterium Greene0714_2]
MLVKRIVAVCMIVFSLVLSFAPIGKAEDPGLFDMGGALNPVVGPSGQHRPGLAGTREALGNLGPAIDPRYKENTGRVNIYIYIGQILQTLLSALGTVLLLVVIYAGYTWFLAGGNEEDVSKAKALIFNAVMGVLIVSFAWLITSFVLNSLRTSEFLNG